MTTERDELVIHQLLQLANDFCYIPHADVKLGQKLLTLLPELNELMIVSLDTWFDTEGKEFSEDHRRKTALRFCLTLGVGAAWFFIQQKEPIDARSLFDLMAAPRGEDAMDEYIEDAVGLWFTGDSDKHSQWLVLCNCCYDLSCEHYDLSMAEEKFQACLSAMYVGALIGFGMIRKNCTKAKYEGDFSWGKDIWSGIIKDKRQSAQAMLEKWTIKCLKTGLPIGGNLVSLPKADSHEHQVECYHQLTLDGDPAIQVIFHIDESVPRLVSIMPRIDSSRTHYLCVDKVFEHEGGAEATIRAHFLDDPSTLVTFYDTEYLKNRDQYFEGQCYVFDLYAVAYNASLVSPSSRTPHMEGEQPLHSFLQIDSPHPEICRFRAPIQATYNEFDFSEPSFYEVEVGIPYRNFRHGKKHDLSVYIPTFQIPDGEQRLTPGTAIEGTLIMMGKMRVQVNFNERPCTEVRSFTPLTQRGAPRRFTHKCKAEDMGQEMNEAERFAFAKKVMKQFLGPEIEPSHEADGPDFMATRHRCMWIKTDEDYTAAERFKTEDITPGLEHYYQTGHLPVMVYVSLYDEQGNPCRWLKGGSYTAQLHYGSMLPGQRMQPREAYKHGMLTQILFEAFQSLHIFPLSQVIHKNLHYTSPNLTDPIITREEFLIHIQGVFDANRYSPEGRMQASLLVDENTGLPYLQLTYPEGFVDRVDIESEHNLITEIRISNVKRGKKETK